MTRRRLIPLALAIFGLFSFTCALPALAWTSRLSFPSDLKQASLTNRDNILTGALSPAEVSVAASSTGKIAFVSDRHGNEEIYTMNPNGSGVVRLTNNAADDLAPVWSPNGKQIAFASNRAGNFQIYVMNANGTGLTRISNNALDEIPYSWKPDGTKLAYMSGTLSQTSPFDSSFDVKVMNLNGSGQINITNNAANDLSPVWSPSGARIAFSSNRDGDYEIYTVAATGGAVTKLTNNTFNDITPAWKPDGTKIAFATDRNEFFPTYFGEIYLMNANGSVQTNLTNSSSADAYPSWSADMTRIAFMSGDINFSNPEDTEFDLYVMSANGSGQTNITNNAVSDILPSWSQEVSISGRVTMPSSTTGIGGVSVTLTSPTPAGFTPITVLTNSAGNYTFRNLPSGRTYKITPTKTGLTFNPTSRTLTTLRTNQLIGPATNFTGAP